MRTVNGNRTLVTSVVDICIRSCREKMWKMQKVFTLLYSFDAGLAPDMACAAECSAAGMSTKC